MGITLERSMDDKLLDKLSQINLETTHVIYSTSYFTYKTFCPMSLCEIVSPIFVDKFEGQITEHRQNQKDI